MALLHDPRTLSSIKSRISTLRPDSQRRWGKMSVDQMLRHVNSGLEWALGRLPVDPVNLPVPRAVAKFLLLYMPWPRGLPTAPELVVGERYDFERERDRTCQLLDEVAARPLTAKWPSHANFGEVGGEYYSRVNAKHLHHHLKQFSA